MHVEGVPETHQEIKHHDVLKKSRPAVADYRPPLMHGLTLYDAANEKGEPSNDHDEILDE